MYKIDDRFYQEPLWDPWEYLGPKRRQRLEKGWPGLFRSQFLENLPVQEIIPCLDDQMGRPSKELHTMLGVVILQQIFDFTDAQTENQFAFNLEWHYALNITDESDDSKYVCERTLRTYRNRIIEKGVDAILFDTLTDKLLKTFGISTDKQRLDSTAIQSNMKQLSRLNVFVRTIEKFLKEFMHRHPRKFQKQMDEKIRQRYVEKEGQGCFAQVKPSEAQTTLDEVAKDLWILVETFKQDQTVAKLESYSLLRRVLEEQCEVVGEAKDQQVQVKPSKEISGDCLQNPSDPDAGYDGHKGSGYRTQVMETYQEKSEDDKNDVLPNSIVYAEVTSIYERDEDAVDPALESTEARDCQPKEVLMDAAYGSDENVQDAKKEGTEIIAPTKGESKKKDDMLILEDFTLDEESGEVAACPAGEKPKRITVTGKDVHYAEFDPETCQQCEFKDYCQVGRGEKGYRMVYTDKQMRLAQRRQQEATEEFRDKYRWRAGVEATMSQLKRVMKIGRLRYRGLGKVRLAVKMKCLGWNLFQAVRAIKDRILAKFQFLIFEMHRNIHIDHSNVSIFRRVRHPHSTERHIFLQNLKTAV